MKVSLYIYLPGIRNESLSVYVSTLESGMKVSLYIFIPGIRNESLSEYLSTWMS